MYSNMSKKIPYYILLTAALLNAPLLALAQSPNHSVIPAITGISSGSIVDDLHLGDASSEQSHRLSANLSRVVPGGLGQSARVLDPPTTPGWSGGSLVFTLKVDPHKINYFTVKLWGSDTSDDRLVLLCAGKQIGYRHLGDVDLLDDGTTAPPLPGRFYYRTCPLPLELTRGKTSVQFEIRSNGLVWGYGTTFAQYQKPMTAATRGIYAVYTHTDGCFTPPSSKQQGEAPANPPLRTTPGPEVLEAVKSRVNNELKKEMASPKAIGQQQLHLLARAYFIKWSAAYHNPAAVTAAVKSLDSFYAAFAKDPTVAQSEPSMYNAGWFGLGFAGDAVRLLSAPLTPSLDQTIDDGNGGNGGSITRRAAYSAMLCASRDWHMHNRRQYTNQSMITDLNIYTANRGVAAIDQAHALPEASMLNLLYQSVGLNPWLGSMKADDSGPEMPLGTDYWEVTAKGLTKELGFTGYYGEVLDWATEIYDATRPAPDQPGNQLIKAQIEKIAHAREVFRYPALDNDGNRAVRAETIVGWRDEQHYPADITYAQRPTWDASPIYEPAATLDPESVGAVQQMFADNQFFQSIQDLLATNSLRQTAGLLDVPDDYFSLKAQAASTARLPMTEKGDFVWADEDDGVVAVKHGPEILYASLYWRARYGINHLARIHFIAPVYDQIAEVHEDEQFVPSGTTFTQPDWTNMAFGGGGFAYDDNVHSAYAAEQLPIAIIPQGVEFKPGDESPYAGRADFYELRFGRYVVGMNSSADKTFRLTLPAGTHPVDLITGKEISPKTTVRVAAKTTVVIYLEN